MFIVIKTLLLKGIRWNEVVRRRGSSAGGVEVLREESMSSPWTPLQTGSAPSHTLTHEHWVIRHVPTWKPDTAGDPETPPLCPSPAVPSQGYDSRMAPFGVLLLSYSSPFDNKMMGIKTHNVLNLCSQVGGCGRTEAARIEWCRWVQGSKTLPVEFSD